MKHVNIPVFVPHLGCPKQCVFCDQRAISGVRSFDEGEARRVIERHLATLGDAEAEIAFFGGSFTGIGRERMTALLELAEEYVRAGPVRGIRFSTRPDFIDGEILEILSRYTITAAELGIQSSSDRVLALSKRGHTAEDSRRAMELLAEAGIPTVGQMMLGLPGAEEALPIRVRRALDAVGPMKLIAGHMGGWGCWEEVLELLPDTGCYLDTAFALGTMTPALDGHAWLAEDLRLLRAEAFCELIARFGADRVLFGTDSPWADPEEEIRKIKGLPLQEAEVRRILGDNMAGLLAGRVNAECWRLPGPAAWQAPAPET